VKEQSHKEEMSAALRGDFERLRERGVAAALVPHDEPEPTAESVDEEPDDGPAREPEPPAPAVETPPQRGGWLSRLAGR
jgi:hypothetical protein